MPEAVSKHPPITLFWHRRDLRLHDNAGLYHALLSGYPVQPIFIFDRAILDELEEKKDRRVEFLHTHLHHMQGQLQEIGATLDVRYGFPLEIFKQLLDEYPVAAVYTNHDYEPYAKARDGQIAQLLAERSIPFKAYKDQCIFERDEVVKKSDGGPYTVFTPYSKQWHKIRAGLLEAGRDDPFAPYPTEQYFSAFHSSAPRPCPA